MDSWLITLILIVGLVLVDVNILENMVAIIGVGYSSYGPLLNQASTIISCCRLLHPKGPRPHTLRTFINGFALWKRPFVVTPSTTLPRPSAGCALDAATMDGSTGGMGPAPNTAPKASPPAAKATPKPSAACYEATELAIRLA
jgi:hypothetical protein